MINRSSRNRLIELQEICRASWVRAALAVVILMGAGMIAGFRVNVSRSLPLGLYRTIGDSSIVERGSIVIVCLPPEWTRIALEKRILGPGNCKGGSYGLGKIVLAVGSDVVDLDKTGLTLNGHPVANSQSVTHDRYGRHMPGQRVGKYIIGPGEVWLFSPHPAAFDSRYIGPVSKSLILSVIWPVWTTGD